MGTVQETIHHKCSIVRIVTKVTAVGIKAVFPAVSFNVQPMVGLFPDETTLETRDLIKAFLVFR